MAITTEQLRQALIKATQRIIALEQLTAQLSEQQHEMSEAMVCISDRLITLDEDLDLTLGKAMKQITEEEITRSMDATRWNPSNPAQNNLIDRIKAKYGTNNNEQ